MHSRAEEINLENDLTSEKSVFRFYKRLIALHKSTPALIQGDFRIISKADDNFMISQRVCKNQTVSVICNFEEESIIDFACNGRIVLANLERSMMNGKYKPYEVAVSVEKINYY